MKLDLDVLQKSSTLNRKHGLGLIKQVRLLCDEADALIARAREADRLEKRIAELCKDGAFMVIRRLESRAIAAEAETTRLCAVVEKLRAIEVTPEMIEAGAEVLLRMDGEDFSIVAELTFRAMIRQSTEV